MLPVPPAKPPITSFRSRRSSSLSQTLRKSPSEVGGVVLHGAVARSHRPVWIFMDRP